MRIKKSKLQKRREDVSSRLWRNKADKAWKEAVFAAGGYKCAVCGSTDHLNAHHLFPRTMLFIRHDLRNGILLCPSHHKYGNVLSAHKNPIRFILWFQKNRPEQWKWLSEIFPHDNMEYIHPEPDFKAAYERLSQIETGKEGKNARSSKSAVKPKRRKREKYDPLSDRLGDAHLGL